MAFVQNSLQVTNEQPILGSDVSYTTDEIKIDCSSQNNKNTGSYKMINLIIRFKNKKN